MPSQRLCRPRRLVGGQPMTLILRGTADTIPADVLAAHIRAARSGQQRLVIVDEGSQLVRRHIDYDRDRLIDAGHANWDIFADHIERLELAEASEAILHQDDVPERVFNAASIVLAEILWYLSSEPGAGLREISAEVRALTYAGLAEHVRLNLDDPEDTRFGWMTLALLQECAGRFAGRPSTIPRVSICHWFAGDARTILFIAAGAGVDDGACRSVNAAIARIAEIERGGGRGVALLAYDDGDLRGMSGADLQPAANRSTGNAAASGWADAAGGAQ